MYKNTAHGAPTDSVGPISLVALARRKKTDLEKDCGGLAQVIGVEDIALDRRDDRRCRRRCRRSDARTVRLFQQ